MMNLKDFGAKLRLARESKRLTQLELVERLGKKDATAISEYENGKRRLAAFELHEYAGALGVPVTYFFREVLAEDELDLALLEWFHSIPKHRRKRAFRVIEQCEPIILGDDEKKK